MPKKSQTPAKNPGNRNKQLQKLSMDEAEKRIRNGTASSQLLITFLNQTTDKYLMEIKRLKSDLSVANAKIKQLESQTDGNELYQKAIEAFKRYSGHYEDDEEDYYDY